MTQEERIKSEMARSEQDKCYEPVDTNRNLLQTFDYES